MHVAPTSAAHAHPQLRRVSVVDQLETQLTGKAAKFFQVRELTEWQKMILQATIEGRNTVVVQRTGSGKSLCFQLPPLISGRLSVVITPTISLMQDQAASLQERGVKAAFLGSTQ